MNSFKFPEISIFWKRITLKNIIIGVIFLLFLSSCSAFLGSVPGLMGDEGDEGQNIIELINNKKPPLLGERSYIGVLTDYARMPFVYTLGFNALALRILTLVASVAVFILGYIVLTRLFGDLAGLVGLITLVFSSTYFTQQRIAWAITFLPLYALLAIFFYRQNKKWSPLLAGLAVGLGANTHILFLATMAGLIAAATPNLLHSIVKNFTRERFKKLAISTLLATIGFWSAFGMQYANLILDKSDQGNFQKNGLKFSKRLSELTTIAPKFISGSVYVASYTAKPFSDNTNMTITILLTTIIVSGIIFTKKRWLLLICLFGLIAHVIVLSYMIEYYALRYFVVFTLWFWLLSGVAGGLLLEKFVNKKIGYSFAILLALFLTCVNFILIIFQFTKTGGSTDNFMIIGSRYDSSAGLVDMNPMLSCIADKTNVFSNNIHIRNRLIFLANGNTNIQIAQRKKDVKWLIDYRMPDSKQREGDACSDLKHFFVTKISSTKEVDWPDEQ